VRILCAAMLCLLTSSRAQTNKYAYDVGDVAREDICTPVQLLVVDSILTEALREAETPRLPAVFRYKTNAVDDPQARLVAAFATMREFFQRSLRFEYGTNKLADAETRDPRFSKFRSDFQSHHKAFPLPTDLARQWAMGRAGSTIILSWSGKLRQTMELFIAPTNLPAEAAASPQVRVLTNSVATESVDLAASEEQSVLVPRENLVTLDQARVALARKFPAAQKGVAAFIAELLVENCSYDPELTRLSREPRLAPLYEGDRYAPGQPIVREGEPITRRIKAALDQLAAAVPPPAPVAEPQVIITSAPAPKQPPYLFYGSGALLFLCLICVAVSWRFLFVSRKSGALIPFPSGPVSRTGTAAPDRDWLEQALVAEQRARELAADARSALVPKFLQWLKSQGVQNLIAQREELITTQKLAETELARLEQMLAEMHAPIQERIKAYEQRILELEQALKAKGEESHELIETMIRLTRQKLEAERQASPGVTWN